MPEDVSTKENLEVKKLKVQREKVQEKMYDVELDILTERKKSINVRIDIRKREVSGQLNFNYYFKILCTLCMQVNTFII